MFRRWSMRLPRWLDVIAVELPGHGFRANEEPIDDLRVLVRGLADAVARALDLPFIAFGHSFGALVAFELCRELRRRGTAAPELLVVAARHAPQLPVVNTHLADGPDEDMQRFFLGFDAPSTPLLRDAATFERLLPMLRADVRMAESYVYEPEPALRCPLLALGGTEDASVSAEGLTAWAACCGEGRFEHQLFPGGHFFIVEHQASLLETLGERIEGLFGDSVSSAVLTRRAAT